MKFIEKLNVKDCPECNGSGQVVLSCCGDNITDTLAEDYGICPSCGEHIGIELEDCSYCDATGKTYKKPTIVCEFEADDYVNLCEQIAEEIRVGYQFERDYSFTKSISFDSYEFFIEIEGYQTLYKELVTEHMGTRLVDTLASDIGFDVRYSEMFDNMSNSIETNFSALTLYNVFNKQKHGIGN